MTGRRTTLYGAHAEVGAKFTDFGGWEMPVSFDSIRTEHEAVRTDVGKFDVSHMGQISVTGSDALELMQRLVTNDVATLEVGDAQYAAITDTDGIMLDDTIIYRLGDRDGDPSYLFVPNAGHNEEMLDRWTKHRDEWGLTATITDRTDDYGMIAVQGPNAIDLVDSLTEEPIETLSRFTHTTTEVAAIEVLIARTGYTGEDGVELLVETASAPAIWSALECQPVGLGARDTLRLEAGLLLGGNEFDPVENPRTPLEAGIGFAVDLETDFIGREALSEQLEAGLKESLIGFGLADRGIPRGGYRILDSSGDPIGMVTSGTQSPTLGRPIGLGYVETDHAEAGNEIAIEVRGEPKMGKVESLPFVD